MIDTWDWKVAAKEETHDTVVTGDMAQNPPFVVGLTSIIVAVYNVNYPLLHFTGHCLGSIKEHTDKTKTPYEIILVDNGSPIRLGKEADYRVDKFVKNEKNLGVSCAWNQGIRVSSGEFVCFLNNDALVFDHWLEDLLEGLKYRDLMMATPMYGEPFSRAVEAAKKREEWLNKPYEESISTFRDFSCVLTQKNVFNALGGLFDEQFFAYNEDLDLLKRMDNLGLTYGSTKRVNTFHVIGATSSNMLEIPKVMDEGREKLKNKIYEGAAKPKSIPEKPEVWGEDVPSVEVPPASYTLDNLPTLSRTSETGDKVFLIKNKTAHWVTSPEVLEALGLGLGDVAMITKELFYQLDFGENIVLENVVKFKNEKA